MSELPRSVPGADPNARARFNEAAVPVRQWLSMTKQTACASALPSRTIDRAATSGPPNATGWNDRRERPIDRAEAEAEIDAGGTDRYGTRRPSVAPRSARQLGIVGC